MSQQMTEAMKSAKTIQQEMTQWENRLETTKNDANNLRRENEILQAEIDNKRTQYAGYIADKEKSIRDRLEKLGQEHQILESKRTEFAGILSEHQKAKASLIQERSDFEKEKSKILGQKQMVDQFIQAVRLAYSLIAE